MLGHSKHVSRTQRKVHSGHHQSCDYLHASSHTEARRCQSQLIILSVSDVDSIIYYVLYLSHQLSNNSHHHWLMPTAVFSPDKTLGYTVRFIYFCERCKSWPMSKDYCRVGAAKMMSGMLGNITSSLNYSAQIWM